MVAINTLIRAFNYNGVELPDPGPALTPEQVRDVYSATFPEILSASVEGPEIKGDKQVYTFRRAVGTKGCHRPLRTTVQVNEGLPYVAVMPSPYKRSIPNGLIQAVKTWLYGQSFRQQDQIITGGHQQ